MYDIAGKKQGLRVCVCVFDWQSVRRLLGYFSLGPVMRRKVNKTNSQSWRLQCSWRGEQSRFDCHLQADLSGREPPEPGPKKRCPKSLKLTTLSHPFQVSCWARWHQLLFSANKIKNRYVYLHDSNEESEHICRHITTWGMRKAFLKDLEVRAGLHKHLHLLCQGLRCLFALKSYSDTMEFVHNTSPLQKSPTSD